MDHILLSSILAFIITFFSIPVIIQIAKDKKLFDEPDERKVHNEVIPTLGGLGIFAGFIIASLMGVPVGFNSLQYIIAACTVIFFLGLKDDILILSASKKIIGQLIAAGIIIKFGDVRITNMYGLFGVNELPYVASIVITVFTIIVITNSFNLIDGVDGLAGSLGLLTTTLFGLYFYIAGHGFLPLSVIAFSLSGALVAFLIYNFSPAKVFMGDTGSLLLGLINSILVIKFMEVAAGSQTLHPIAAAPIVGIAILIIPLFDTIRVFTLRILNRRSPFSPDRIHIHHFLLDLGLSHRMVTYTCIVANLAIVFLAYFLRNTNSTLGLFILFIAAFSFVSIIYLIRPIKNQSYFEKDKLTETNILKSHKTITMQNKIVEVE